MQVILLENLEGKGAAGEVVKVADGYARNYLLPRNIAIPATDSNVKTLEHRRAKLAERKAQDLGIAEAIKEKIDSKSITFEAKSGEGGRLFGSITSQDVADAIHEHFGVFVDKRKISDGTPIKNVGVHPVTIKIFQEVSAVMRILVGTPEEIEAAEVAAKLAAEKAAARAAAEAEAAARAAEEEAAKLAAADAVSDAPDYDDDEQEWSFERSDPEAMETTEAAPSVETVEAETSAEEVEVPVEEAVTTEDQTEEAADEVAADEVVADDTPAEAAEEAPADEVSGDE